MPQIKQKKTVHGKCMKLEFLNKRVTKIIGTQKSLFNRLTPLIHAII